MNIVYSDKALTDLIWFGHYYDVVFPDGAVPAYKRMENCHILLASNPYLGRPSEDQPKVRELVIPKTPFTLIYTLSETQIEILRIWDERQGFHD